MSGTLVQVVNTMQLTRQKEERYPFLSWDFSRDLDNLEDGGMEDSGGNPLTGLSLGNWMKLIRERMGDMDHSQNNLVRMVKKSTNGETKADTRTKRSFMRSLRPVRWFILSGMKKASQKSEGKPKRSSLMDSFCTWEKALNKTSSEKRSWFNLAVYHAVPYWARTDVLQRWYSTGCLRKKIGSSKLGAVWLQTIETV